MQNPILVEVTRGGIMESCHRGAIAVCDGDGGTVLAVGDISRPIFPRSAVKAFQALPLLESGAADRFGLSEAEIALACASHSGEPRHAETALAMLRKVGRDRESLECGTHWPMGDKATRALAAAGASPGPQHNNCSGKHAGFVCLACASGHDPSGYVQPSHFVQRETRAAMEAITSYRFDEQHMGIDGCSIPAWAMPLQALALGFARFGTGHGLAPARAAAAQRIRAAAASHPFMVAGTGRFDTDVMEALGARAFTKTGAEGVFLRSHPHTTIDGCGGDGGVDREGIEVLEDLRREFAGRREDKGAGGAARLVDQLVQDREEEGGGLPRAGHRTGEDVLAGHRVGDGFGLDGRGAGESELFQSLEEGGMELEGRERQR